MEPILLFLVAVLIGEAVRTKDLFTYLPIIVAVALLAADGGWFNRSLARSRRDRVPL